MNRLKTNRVLRGLALALCTVSAVLAFWTGLATLMYWDDMWLKSDYYDSAEYAQDCQVMESRVWELVELRAEKQAGTLPYTQQERLARLEEMLAAENTNYRFRVRLNDTAGTVVLDNLEGQDLETVADGVQMGENVRSSGEEYHEQDYTYWDEDRQRQMLQVRTAEGFAELDPAEETPGAYNQYGWYTGDGEIWDYYDEDHDSRIQRVDYVLESGVLKDMIVDDLFREGMTSYASWQVNLPAVGLAALIRGAAFLITFAYLCAAAGHRRDVPGLVLGPLDRVPLDAYALVVVVLLGLLASLGDAVSYRFNTDSEPDPAVWIGLMVFCVLIALVCVLFLLSVAVRLKTHTLLRNTLIWRLCAWAGRGLGRAGRWLSGCVRLFSLNVRLTVLFVVFLLVNAFLVTGLFNSYSGAIFFLLGLLWFNGAVLMALCRWGSQWKGIRQATAQIVGGDPTVQIDTKHMYPDLAEHAGQLNDLGSAINHAVEERLRSEHFKAELITNVSHDLKTPLTSIINYVDLLKKEPIDNPKAQEYLEVLDRKSQRLKKLTEDLVEASKASTGNVTVNAARMDVAEFTQQAAAEYEERLAQQGLTLITKMPERPVHIQADGRHMWRILDNLLNNCVKYALEGTRVYLDVVEWDGKASISLKNISRDPLNLGPDELMERFVRGDSARTTEGSGLGLSIARSLTEVQGGTFRLSTDGDLFKATVYFPLAPEPESQPQVPETL